MRRIVLGAAVSGLLAASISIGMALAADGDLDTTGFGSGTGKVVTDISANDDGIASIAVQSDGKIVAAGYAKVSGTKRFAVARYNSDGTLDTTGFGSGTGTVTTMIGTVASWAYGVALQTDGKIVVAGAYVNGGYWDYAVVRYLSDGSLDPTFGTGGIVKTAISNMDEEAYAVAIQSDGKIVVAGDGRFGGPSDFVAVRYTTTGVLDGSFGVGPDGTDGNADDGIVRADVGVGGDYAYGLAIQADGMVVLAGYASGFTGSDVGLARFTSDGQLDSNFGVGGTLTTSTSYAYDQANAVIVQPDGRVVVVGHSYNDISNDDFLVVRYTSSGLLDDTFGVGPDGIDGNADDGIVTTPIVASKADRASAVTLQTDGRIIVAGTSDLDNPTFSMVRYLANGSLDSAFGSGGKKTTVVGSKSTARTVAVAPDNDIVIAGYSGVTPEEDFALARFTATTTTASLSSLALSSGTVSPTFAAATTSYTASVTNGTSSLTVTPTATDANATISINGVTTASGAASASIPLAVGPNTVTIALTAQDGVTTKSYTVTVTRAAASVTPTPLTLKVKKTMTTKVALASARKTIPRGAKVSITVVKASKKVCSATSTAIKGLKAGTCTVTIAVTPKATKQVKKPATTRTTVTITVN